MDLDFLIKRYEWELDRKDKITGGVSFPVTVLIALGGVLVTMAKGLSLQTRPVSIGYFVALGFAVWTTGACMRRLSQAYRGETYGYLPNLYELEQFRRHLLDHGAAGQEATGEDEFTNQLRERIIEVTDLNTAANDTRQAALDRANVLLILAVIETAACGVFYVIDQILKR